jgi:uncharacterized RDD family membrane protein YckC
MATMMNPDQRRSEEARQRIRVIGFGRRLISTLIDALIVTFFSYILMGFFSVVSVFVASYRPDADYVVFNSLFAISGILVSVLYFVGFWVKSGQTIGKNVLGLQVIRTNGQPLSWGKGLLRYVGYLVSGLVFSLGFIWIAFDRNRQGWHDKIAGTYVINDEDEGFSAAEPLEIIQSDPGRGWIWLAVWVVIAVLVPPALFSSLFFLGPIVSGLLSNLW